MENCTIYSHKIDFDTIIEVVKIKLPKAKVKVNDGGIQKQLTATLKGGIFSKSKTLKINYRQRVNPSYNLDNIDCGLSENLAGMTRFMQSFPTDNESLKNQLLIKIMSCNSEMPFIVEPNFDSNFKSVLLEVLDRLDAIVFAQPNSLFTNSVTNHFTDKKLNLILDQQGLSNVTQLDVQIDSDYYDEPKSNASEEQILRKNKSETFLKKKEVKVNENLPYSIDSNSVTLRSKKEVCLRIHALLMIALKGEGVEHSKIVEIIRVRNIDSFSANEELLIKQENLSQHDKVNSAWRYESLYALLWAVNIIDELKYPNEICDVKNVVSSVMNKSREDFDRMVNLRTKEEILDKLDLTYRMNWVCVDARIKNIDVSGSLNCSVLYERHYALNWLTNNLDQDWDDVQTNT